jgi:hypothetical protein
VKLLLSFLCIALPDGEGIKQDAFDLASKIIGASNKTCSIVAIAMIISTSRYGFALFRRTVHCRSR